MLYWLIHCTLSSFHREIVVGQSASFSSLPFSSFFICCGKFNRSVLRLSLLRSPLTHFTVCDLVTHSFLSVCMQVSPLRPCYIRSPCAATETALRNVTSLPTRSCHVPRSPEVPMRAWSWPSARNWPASSSTLRTKTPSLPTAPADGGLSYFVTASRMTANCCHSQMPRCPGTRLAGTWPKQPWECWSATQQRSWGCCSSQNLMFGPVVTGKAYAAGTSCQEDRRSTDTTATAEMNVSWILFSKYNFYGFTLIHLYMKQIYTFLKEIIF